MKCTDTCHSCHLILPEDYYNNTMALWNQDVEDQLINMIQEKASTGACLLALYIHVLLFQFPCLNADYRLLPPAGMTEFCCLIQVQSVHASWPLAVVCPVFSSATFFAPTQIGNGTVGFPQRQCFGVGLVCPYPKHRIKSVNNWWMKDREMPGLWHQPILLLFSMLVELFCVYLNCVFIRLFKNGRCLFRMACLWLITYITGSTLMTLVVPVLQSQTLL